MRSVLVIAALAGFVLAIGSAGPAAGATSDARAAAAPAYWSLRADMRMCPSPMCGGWFARRANHATSVCAGGKRRAECYVAALDLGSLRLTADARTALRDTLAHGGLVRGRLATGYAGRPDLQRLTVSAAWQRVGSAAQSTLYRVVDTGMRCIAAPCFNLDA